MQENTAIEKLEEVIPRSLSFWRDSDDMPFVTIPADLTIDLIEDFYKKFGEGKYKLCSTNNGYNEVEPKNRRVEFPGISRDEEQELKRFLKDFAGDHEIPYVDIHSSSHII